LVNPDQKNDKLAQGETTHVQYSSGATEAKMWVILGGASLIVMGSRGLGGIRRALMGSVSDSVVRHAHCPVLVVRGEPVSFPIKILLATDGSKEAELAATTAADLASSTGSELHVLSVFPGSAYVHPYYEVHFPEAAERLRREARESRQEVLDEQVERIREAGGSVAQTHIRTGEAAAEIVALAEKMGAGLLVMGSHGLGGIRRALIGSVSAAVVPHAHCPVLVVRRKKEQATQPTIHPGR
jgi:nucleotide-binding universal stress UspA family protein